VKAMTLDSGKISIKTPFNRDFVDDLKAAIDWLDRDWNPAEAPKCWVVSAECGDVAVAIEVGRESVRQLFKNFYN